MALQTRFDGGRKWLGLGLSRRSHRTNQVAGSSSKQGTEDMATERAQRLKLDRLLNGRLRQRWGQSHDSAFTSPPPPGISYLQRQAARIGWQPRPARRPSLTRLAARRRRPEENDQAQPIIRHSRAGMPLAPRDRGLARLPDRHSLPASGSPRWHGDRRRFRHPAAPARAARC